MSENIWNKIEEPKVNLVDSPVHEQKETHPAYAQISASRISGHAALYGSDFVHHGFVEIKISHSELNRGLSRDWPFAKKEVVSVWLSEAQWATFVSSMNIGSGVQCTLRHINMNPVPMLPAPKKRIDQFRSEAKKTTEEAEKNLRELADLIGSSNLSVVKKKELLKKVEFASRAIGSSVDFVLKQFGEHMENVTEKAKIEIDAYINDQIKRVGITALSERPIKMISNNESTK